MIPAAVVDASVAIKWVLEEEGSGLARLLSACSLRAPDLFPIECANILWKKVRLRELSRRGAHERLQLLLSAPVMIVPSNDLLVEAIELAFDLHHPVYDCVYLALAMRHGIPLVSADERLIRGARKARKTAALVVPLSQIAD